MANCNLCGGSGRMNCDNADCSDGIVRCKACDGLGKVSSGGGSQNCANCYGTGKENCHECNGRGEVTCSRCGGSGESS